MAPAERTYQVKDLAGCQVVTDQGECLGILVDVLPSGGNDIFVVQQGLRETLVPALKSIVRSIDVEQKRIEVVLPPGLREIYEGA
jgi:16S rRNA processing protein RimM